MKLGVKIVLAANLLIVTALVFIYPQFMVSPGKLLPGHQELETDCFACHSSWRGSTSARCIACHVPEQIGLATTTGQAITRRKSPVAFHQELAEQDCVACHSDHSGVRRYRQQGRFDHGLLQAATREQCQACHQSPTDALHQKITGNCSQCHRADRWIPATFDHDKYFALDRHHNDRCVTCHVRNDYSRYTCYGCHEHSPASIRREHIEEGIGNFDNCVECHRSGNKHDMRGERGGERGERHHGRREHDD